MKADRASSLTGSGRATAADAQPQAEPDPAQPAADPAQPERAQADLHMHTSFSDGWPGPVQVVRQARRLGLAVIAVTDHDTIEGALWAADYAGSSGLAPEVIVGEEISPRQGHVVGLFLEKRIRPGQSAAATIAAIHRQGGIAFAPHPFWRTKNPSRPRRVHGVGWQAAELDFDAIEVENSTPGFYLFNQLAQRLNEDAGRAALGNSDAHILDAIGRSYTSFPGRTALELRRAVEGRLTEAHRRRYPAMALVRYAAWGIEHRRLRRLASARRSA
jgi:predicted metal-dependent phosphoesterase TrpH